MVQIIWQERYDAKALSQHGIKETIRAHRGEILAKNLTETISLATTKEGWLLAINPKNIKDKDQLYDIIVKEAGISMSKEEFIARASKENDPYEVIEHRVPHKAKKAVEDYNYPGVIFEPEEWRFYPAGNFASHVLGFVGADYEGKYGIERYLNKDLLGIDGVFEGEKTLGGRLLAFGKKLIQEKRDGSDIYLSIDSNVQDHLQKQLGEAYKQYGAESAGGIIINPKTGAIIAMAAFPSYDPNIYSKVKDISVYKNPNIESRFEMGSIIKSLTMSAALDAGVVTQNSVYNDTGEIKLDNYTISNYDKEARGMVNIQEILSQSLNVGAAFLMRELGRERFRTYMYAFGLEELTGITLPNEIPGDLKNLKSSRDVEYATASFGQGIALTPLATARAMSILANGGFLINPYIVEKIRYVDGEESHYELKEPKRILKEETSKMITRMLVEAADTKLAGGKGKIPGYSIAAKTGTAQIASANKRGYSDEFMHTFFGYGPAFDPQFLIFLYLEKPKGIRYASESLTEPFRKIMRYLFSYYKVPPDRPQELKI